MARRMCCSTGAVHLLRDLDFAPVFRYVVIPVLMPAASARRKIMRHTSDSSMEFSVSSPLRPTFDDSAIVPGSTATLSSSSFGNPTLKLSFARAFDFFSSILLQHCYYQMFTAIAFGRGHIEGNRRPRGAADERRANPNRSGTDFPLRSAHCKRSEAEEGVSQQGIGDQKIGKAGKSTGTSRSRSFPQVSCIRAPAGGSGSDTDDSQPDKCGYDAGET